MRRNRISRGILAALFSFFMVFGRSFARYDSWEGVLGSRKAALLSSVQALAWFVVFFFLVSAIFRFLDRCTVRQRPTVSGAPKLQEKHPSFPARTFSAYQSLLWDKPFFIAFSTLMIINLPYMILSYPGIFMGDTNEQMWQILPNDPSLNSHHPLAHTMLLGVFVKLGLLLHNENLGVFLFCLVQSVLFCLAESFSLGTLAKLQVNGKIIAGFLVYYAVHPAISAYLFLMSKDIYFTIFFLLFYVLLYLIFFSGRPARKSQYFLFGVSIIGMVWFRNEGKYIVCITFLFILFRKKTRRKALAGLAMGIAAALIMEKIICPALDVTPGQKSEMLSIPFQQTARYLRDAGDDVTEEEQQAIDNVLAYQELAERYDPNISDPVKGTYKKDDSALGDYFKAWFSMFLKHPGIYLQATMNNYYQYFYPGSRIEKLYSYEHSTECMDWVNTDLQTSYAYPQALDSLRTNFEALRESVFALPVLRLLKTPAVYTWIALLLLCYSIANGCFQGFLFCLPMVTHILVMIAGPTNGYYGRYEHPMFVYLPMVAVMTLMIVKAEN